MLYLSASESMLQLKMNRCELVQHYLDSGYEYDTIWFVWLTKEQLDTIKGLLLYSNFFTKPCSKILMPRVPGKKAMILEVYWFVEETWRYLIGQIRGVVTQEGAWIPSAISLA